MDVPLDGERYVAPQVITNVDKLNGGYQELLHYLASVIPARFSCNVSHNKNTLQVESVLTYTRNKFLFFEK